MFKKNSWIVALVLALSFAALFTGCVDAITEEGGEDEATYTEVPLGAFNVWGGQAYQQGWGVAGINFSGIGDKKETAKDLGYKLEDFQKAKYLVIEMEDATHPKGNVDIIWGGENEDGTDAGIGGWNQTGGIAFKKDGSTITIELAKVLKDYSKFKAATTKKVKIVLQAGGEPDKLAGLVKSAKLLVPDVEEPFVPVTGLTLVNNSFPYPGDLALTVGAVTPDDATNQLVIWSIKSYTPVGGTALTIDKTSAATITSSRAALLAKVAFKPTTLTVTPAKTYVDNSVDPPLTVTAIAAVTMPWQSENVIYLPSWTTGSVGDTIVVTARIVDGKLNAAGDFEDYTQDFTITVADKLPISFKVDGTVQTTIDYSGQANSGASSTMVQSAGGYTISMVGNSYGNAYHYFKVDFGTGNIGDYTGLKFKYTAVSGDANYKTVRVKAALAAPPSGYNPGLDISRLKTGGAENGVALDAKFGDNADDSPTTVGAYAANITTLSAQSAIYVWFLPWSDGSATVFTITDIEFYK